MTTFYTVACAVCGDFYRTRHHGRALGVLEGMKPNRRMHGNGTVDDHTHDGLAVVEQNREALTA